MDSYQTFIAKSRYSRFIDTSNRREHWPETVDRYMQFMNNHLVTKHNYVMGDELLRVKDCHYKP
jgi:ribonucleoside-triphosphate reductase